MSRYLVEEIAKSQSFVFHKKENRYTKDRKKRSKEGSFENILKIKKEELQ